MTPEFAMRVMNWLNGPETDDEPAFSSAPADITEYCASKTNGKWCDTEERHVVADAVLCDLLTAHGYGDLVDAYNEIFKYYI